MGAADAAAARSTLGLTALATTSPGTGVATALGVALGSAGAVIIRDGAAGLTISTTSTGGDVFKAQSTDSTGYSEYTALNDTGTSMMSVGWGNADAGGLFASSAYISFDSAVPFRILTAGVAQADFAAAGAITFTSIGTNQAITLNPSGTASVVIPKTTSLLLGTAGSAVGNIGFRNATSGTITVAPTTGALGTVTLTLPAVTATVCAAATSTTTTQALFATSTAGAPAFRALAAGDLPSTLTSGTAITNAALTTPTLGTPASGTLTNCTNLPLGSLTDSVAGADRLAMWDQSATNWVECTLGTNLSFSGTTLNATGGAGGGDVSGPVSSTNTAIALWNGTDGTTIQDSVVLVDPATGDMTGIGDMDGASLSVSTITIGGVTASGVTGTSNVVFSTTPTITTPVFSGAFSGTYSLGGTVTFPTTVSLSTSGVLTTGTIEVGAASDTTISRTGAGDIGVEGNRIFRVGGADVPVADGGTGLSSGTSGGVLAFTASGTLASSGALTANAIVIGGGAGVAPSTTTTGTGVLTALGVNVGSAGAFVTFNGALGTPSSGTLTSCTGLPASALTSGTLAANVTLGESTGQIILDAALSADGTWSGIQEAGTAGATLAFGDLCYFSVTDSRWELADADADSTSGAVKLGICVLAAAADGSATNMLLFGKIRADAKFPTFTIGAPVYVSTTTGAVQVAQPSGTDDVIRIVGYGNTADELFFNPDGAYLTHT